MWTPVAPRVGLSLTSDRPVCSVPDHLSLCVMSMFHVSLSSACTTAPNEFSASGRLRQVQNTFACQGCTNKDSAPQVVSHTSLATPSLDQCSLSTLRQHPSTHQNSALTKKTSAS